MPASPRQPARPTFKEGDLVVQYRHFMPGGFVDGMKPDQKQAKWRVLSIEPVQVVFELVEGRYELFEDEPDARPGHLMTLRRSTVYRRQFGRTHPNQQAWDEYGVVG